MYVKIFRKFIRIMTNNLITNFQGVSAGFSFSFIVPFPLLFNLNGKSYFLNVGVRYKIYLILILYTKVRFLKYICNNKYQSINNTLRLVQPGLL